MKTEQWASTVGFVRDDVRTILRAQRIHRDIKTALDQRDLSPLEEDFIEADLNTEGIGASRSFEIDGVRVVVRKLHRRGLRAADVSGADLLYEIEGQKYTTIQYKTPGRTGRVANDQGQLDELIHNCPEISCGARLNWPRCGSWHAIRGPDIAFYHQACEAASIFAGAKSRNVDAFASGLSKDTFDELFALCWIGAPLSPHGMAGAVAATLNADRVLFAVQQRGRF